MLWVVADFHQAACDYHRKVLAMCTIALSQIIWFAAVCGIGGFAMFSLAGSPIQQVPTAMDPGDFDMNAMMEAISESFSSFNALSIVLLIVIFLMGFLFYSLIAGLFGASVSRAEDLQSSMQPMALISVLGFYLSYFPSITGNISQENVLIAISRYLPISSPFALPSAILLGEMTPLEIGISLVLLGVSLVLMALLVSKVYEAIVLHNGNRLKFSEIIKLAKTSKKYASVAMPRRFSWYGERFWGAKPDFRLGGKSQASSALRRRRRGLRRERFSFRLILKVTLTGKFTY